ncbi:hypothetical protein BBP40_005938 [Aspergillus hancockii]|nr:hypothetical protein BBP40_005938 [Aspergillus hancockii]
MANNPSMRMYITLCASIRVYQRQPTVLGRQSNCQPHTQFGLGSISSSSAIQSSRPIGIPFPAQHRILLTLQRQLERSGFNFAQTWHPSLCQAQGWDCAEKMELHTLFRMLDHEFSPRKARWPQMLLDGCKKVLSVSDTLPPTGGGNDIVSLCKSLTRLWSFRWSSLLDGYDQSCHQLKLNLAACMDQCLDRDQGYLRKQRRLQEAARRVAQQTVHQLIVQVE